MRNLLFAFFAFFAVKICAAPPVTWDAVINKPEAQIIDIWQGETRELQPRYMYEGKPWQIPTGTVVTLYWSTNNFATNPWGTNGTLVKTCTGRVDVTWSPACDSGAPAYQFFVGLSEPTGLLYRAWGAIHMHKSPGWQPSKAPNPVWDGWSANYTYATFAQLQAWSNSLASVQQSIVSNAIASIPAQTTQVYTAQAGTSTWATVAGSATDATARAMASAASNSASSAQATANAAVPQTTTITINGNTGTLTSNLAFSVQGGSGSASFATNAYTLLQPDTNAWLVVTNGYATLFTVSAITNYVITAATNLNPSWFTANGIIFPPVGTVFVYDTYTHPTPPTYKYVTPSLSPAWKLGNYGDDSRTNWLVQTSFQSATIYGATNGVGTYVDPGYFVITVAINTNMTITNSVVLATSSALGIVATALSQVSAVAQGSAQAIYGAVTGVSSVFGRTGDVTATTGDYTAAQVGAVSTNDTRYKTALTNTPTFSQVLTAGRTANYDASGMAIYLPYVTSGPLASYSSGIDFFDQGSGHIQLISDGGAGLKIVSTNGDVFQGDILTAETPGDGSMLTGITAAQVGAVATNDAHYINSLTSIAGLNISTLNNDSAFLTGMTLYYALGLYNVSVLKDDGTYLRPSGNGSQLTGITASQVAGVLTNLIVIGGTFSKTNGDGYINDTNDTPLSTFIATSNSFAAQIQSNQMFSGSGIVVQPSSSGATISSTTTNIIPFVFGSGFSLASSNGTTTVVTVDTSAGTAEAAIPSITNAINIISNAIAGPYQPWTAILTPPASGGTTLVTFANGTLPLLVCTGAQVVGVNATSGYGTAGINHFTLALWATNFSITVQSNAYTRWGTPISLSQSRTNHLMFRGNCTNDWTIYQLQ